MFASSAWDPMLSNPDTTESLRTMLTQMLWSTDVANWIIDVITIQRDLLIYGGNHQQTDYKAKNGQAYIEGSSPSLSPFRVAVSDWCWSLVLTNFPSPLPSS